MRWWRPSAFKRVMEEKAVGPTAISRGLESYGFDYRPNTIKLWQRAGSEGPKHPVTVIAIADILGCAPEEIAPPDESNADKTLRLLRRSVYRDSVRDRLSEAHRVAHKHREAQRKGYRHQQQRRQQGER